MELVSEITNFFFFKYIFFLRGRAQGRPLVSEGHGALLKMPRRNTNTVW
jgi:hypothetical protein